MKYISSMLFAGIVTAALPAVAAVDLSKLPPPSGKQGVTYEKDIRPLFEASCFRCHGEQRPKAQLRLDSLEAALKGSKDGPVIEAGNSEKSKLVMAVSRLDDKTAMPPKPRAPRPGAAGGTNAPAGGPPPNDGANPPGGGPGGPGGNRPPPGPPAKPLTAEEVGLVRAWIDQGAK
jgi:Planctomycete cytochrome C